jgi:hypothetical protein
MAAVRKVREFRGTLFAVLAGSILALGGVFWVIHAFASDPEATQKEFAAEVERVNRTADIIEKDRRMEELLAEPRYREEARSLWTKLDRDHAKAHAAATLEKEARQEVPPFLRWMDVLKREPKELVAKAGEAKDELRALQSRYASTSFGDRLRAIEPLLEVSPLPQRPSIGAEVGWSAGVQKAMEDLAEVHFKRLKKECGELVAEGRRAEARMLLEKALRGYEGFPQQSMIRALLEELR